MPGAVKLALDERCSQCSGKLQLVQGAQMGRPLWSDQAQALRFVASGGNLSLILFLALVGSVWQFSALSFHFDLAILASFLLLSCFAFAGVSSLVKASRSPESWPLLTKASSEFEIKKHGGSALLATASLSGVIYLWQSANVAAAVLAVTALITLAPLLLLKLLVPRGGIAAILAKLNAGYFATVFSGLCSFVLTFLAVNFVHVHLPPVYAFPCAVTAIGIGMFSYCATLALAACELTRDQWPGERTHVGVKESEFDARLELALKQGQYERVQDLLEGELFRLDSRDYRLEQMHKLLTYTEDWKGLAKFSQSILHYYLSRGRESEAIAVARQLRGEMPAYKMNDLKLMLRLAKACEKADETGLLLWLAQNAHLRFREQELLVAELYLLVSKVLRTKLDDPSRAETFKRFAQSCVRQHQDKQGAVKSTPHSSI